MKKLNISLKLIITGLVFFAAITVTYSETGYGFGVTGGCNIDYNQVKYEYFCNGCFPMTDNHSNSNFAGIVFEYFIKNNLDFSILAKLYFTRFNFFFTHQGDKLPSLTRSEIDPNQYVTTYSETRWVYYGTLSFITFELTPQIKIPKTNFNIFAGTSVSYLYSSDYTETENMVTPLNARFAHSLDPDSKIRYTSNGRIAILKEGEIPYKNDIRYGFKAGLSYDIEIWRIKVSPFISVDIPLNPMIYKQNTDCLPAVCTKRADFHWKIWFAQAGMDFKFQF